MKFGIILTIQRKVTGQIEVPADASSQENDEARDKFISDEKVKLAAGEVIVASNVKPIVEHTPVPPATPAPADAVEQSGNA